MNRIIRPIGKVSSALKRHGYRQQAVIFVDGKQVENVAILSKQVDKKLRFEGHYIDANGELHKTNPFVDMKKAAAKILEVRDTVNKPAEPTAAEKRAARRGVKPAKPAPRARRPRRDSDSEGATLIDCPGCGFIHRDDAMCM